MKINFLNSAFWTLFTLALLLQLAFVLTNNNPITALINLITLTLTTSILLLIENVCFLPWVFIIIYVGAVSMLFLFIVMLMTPTTKIQNLWKGITFWVLLFIAHLWSLIQEFFISFGSNKIYLLTEDSAVNLAVSMYEDNFMLIVVLTFLLLSTLLSAYILSRPK